MPRRALFAAVVLAAGCSRPAASTSPASPVPSAVTAAPAAAGSAHPGASPTASPVPIHVRSNGAGGKDVTITESRKGRIIYDVTAHSSEAQTGTAGATAHLAGPHIIFHDKGGKTTTADAPEATVTERDKSVVMTGGVHARSQAGAVLTCDRLRYDGGTETFHGDGHVALRSPGGLTLSGERIDGDLRLENVRVRGGATP